MIVKKVAGVDLSMTATGTMSSLGELPRFSQTIKTKGTRDDRLVVIRDRVLEIALDADLVMIEGYLNHSHSAGITGMVHGAVRCALIERNILYATFPPSSLKKYATGRGGASKTDMALAAFRRAGLEFANDNECDAWWLWVAGNDYLGQPVFDLPKAQREALKAVKRWQE